MESTWNSIFQRSEVSACPLLVPIFFFFLPYFPLFFLPYFSLFFLPCFPLISVGFVSDRDLDEEHQEQEDLLQCTSSSNKQSHITGIFINTSIR